MSDTARPRGLDGAVDTQPGYRSTGNAVCPEGCCVQTVDVDLVPPLGRYNRPMFELLADGPWCTEETCRCATPPLASWAAAPAGS